MDKGKGKGKWSPAEDWKGKGGWIPYMDKGKGKAKGQFDGGMFGQNLGPSPWHPRSHNDSVESVGFIPPPPPPPPPPVPIASPSVAEHPAPGNICQAEMEGAGTSS